MKVVVGDNCSSTQTENLDLVSSICHAEIWMRNVHFLFLFLNSLKTSSMPTWRWLNVVWYDFRTHLSYDCNARSELIYPKINVFRNDINRYPIKRMILRIQIQKLGSWLHYVRLLAIWGVKGRIKGLIQMKWLLVCLPPWISIDTFFPSYKMVEKRVFSWKEALRNLAENIFEKEHLATKLVSKPKHYPLAL